MFSNDDDSEKKPLKNFGYSEPNRYYCAAAAGRFLSTTTVLGFSKFSLRKGEKKNFRVMHIDDLGGLSPNLNALITTRRKRKSLAHSNIRPSGANPDPVGP